MNNGDALFRGIGRPLTLLVSVCGVLLLGISPAMAQQEQFPGEIVGVGEMPPQDH
jgi:hypothetical protein